MRGYYNGLSMLNELCKSYDIVLIQEHCKLDKLNLVNSNFNYATVSAMDAKCASGILRGRPFGGTAILWHINLINMGIHVKLLHRDKESRLLQ